ncbi:AAA family ATPase [Mobiluncus curtisii]|uniref:AAA family ATPase n=1 Tax=Mobiluncus curtisii TaxID=2051 RepID=UPI0014702544|nr:AAA family ATPase [Mobiluncus curtisii]NMW44297.1 AAA family ATPase [Mobiluncus curtisii]NMX06023.1 AAA family ATPase [Mobiluncus curtisii]
MEQLRFFWDGFIPANTVGFIAGAGGCGKSTLVSWIVAKFTQGTLPGTYEGIPGRVLMVSPEDLPAATTKPRLKVNGADCTRVQMLKMKVFAAGKEHKRELTLPRDMPDITQAVTDFRTYYPDEPLLVVLDPITVAMSGDENKAPDVQAVVYPLNALAQDYGVTIIGIKHNRKGVGIANEMMAGAKDWQTAARWVISVAARSDLPPGSPNTSVFQVAKLNCAKKPETAYEFTITSGIAGLDGSGNPVESSKVSDPVESQITFEEAICSERAELMDGETRNEKQKIAEYIRECLQAKGVVLATEVTKECKDVFGVSDKTVRRAFNQSGAKLFRTREVPPKVFWYLSEMFSSEEQLKQYLSGNTKVEPPTLIDEGGVRTGKNSPENGVNAQVAPERTGGVPTEEDLRGKQGKTPGQPRKDRAKGKTPGQPRKDTHSPKEDTGNLTPLPLEEIEN